MFNSINQFSHHHSSIVIKVERCNHHQGSIQSINSIIIIVQSLSRWSVAIIIKVDGEAKL
jgi:hypothetical protein